MSYLMDAKEEDNVALYPIAITFAWMSWIFIFILGDGLGQLRCFPTHQYRCLSSKD